MVTAERVRVVDPDMNDVPSDGMTMGEIVMRGNDVMNGYFRDADATELAFTGGWFHSGDLGVMHPDGYVELMDRAKDIVISGGENISTVEVEQALVSHPAVADVAVIGIADDRWGERPKAFVVLAPRDRPPPNGISSITSGRESPTTRRRMRSSSSPRCPGTRPASSRSTNCADSSQQSEPSPSPADFAWGHHPVTDYRVWSLAATLTRRSARRSSGPTRPPD